MTETFAPPAWGSKPSDRRRPDRGRRQPLRVREARATASTSCCSIASDDGAPRVIEARTRRSNRTGPYWHAFVPGIGPASCYSLRGHGPFAPERGLRFAADRVLLDPYGRGVAVPAGYARDAGGVRASSDAPPR